MSILESGKIQLMDRLGQQAVPTNWTGIYIAHSRFVISMGPGGRLIEHTFVEAVVRRLAQISLCSLRKQSKQAVRPTNSAYAG